MKFPRFPAFACRALGTSAVITLSSTPAHALDRYWDATGTDWAPAANWSTTSSAAGANPPAAPGSSDIAIFTVTGLSAVARSVNLGGTQSALGLRTLNQGFITSLVGGSGTSILNLGTSGINHTAGGLVVGSTTAGQEVNVVLQGDQSWTSSTAFSGGAMVVNNAVNAGVNSTLTLTGTNVGASNIGAFIGGPVSDGAGVLSLTKTGIGIWSLNGASSYTGPTTVSAGRLNLNVGNLHGPGVFTVASGATLFLRAGGTTGFTSTRLDAMHQTGNFATGSNLLLEVNGAIYSTANGGDYILTKSGAADLALYGITSRTGITTVSTGTLRVRDLQPGGVPSSIGASSAAAANLVLASGTRLIYDGGTASTDRLFTFAGGLTLESSGTGPVQFNGTGSHVSSGTGARTITLLGSNTGDNLIAGALGANTNTSITKRGGGSWRISGTNAFTGTARIDGGKLTFDYSNGDPLNTTNLTTNCGTMVLKGTGATTDSIPTLTFAVSQSSGTTLKLEGGMALTAGTFASNNLTQRNDFIDLFGHAGNSLSIGALGSTLSQVNGIIMANGSTGAGRANIVMRAADGSYGFPALSGVTTGTLQKTTGLVELDPGTISMASNSTNYLLRKNGTYLSNTDLIFGTITVETTLGAVTVDLNGERDLSPTGLGKAFLFSGPNNATLNAAVGNNDVGSDSAQWFHNYLSPGATLSLLAGLGKSQFQIFGGPGFTDYNGIGFGANLLVNGGLFRISKNQSDGAAESVFKVSNGGVIEIGADISIDNISVPAPDFTKPISSANGGIRFMGDSGISAYTTLPGGKRLVKFAVYIPEDFSTGEPARFEMQNLKWGTGFFLTVPESETTDGEYAFKLSSDRSNATVDIINPIDLNGKMRVVEVANGSATVDALLGGALGGDAPSGLVKKGAGTLQLGGVNTYTGETRIMEGTLKVDSVSLYPTSRLWIDSGGTIEVSGTVHVASVIINGIPKYGVVTGPGVTGTGTLISDAPMTPYAQWVADKALAEAVSAPTFDADNDGLRNLIEYAVGTEPKTPNGSVLTITGTTTRTIQLNHASGRTDISAVLESSDNLAAPWTTIATSTGGAAFTSGAANVSVSENANAVTVVDNRTPAPTARFYRLRVEK